MSVTETLVALTSDAATTDELTHIVCCNEDVAYCGAQVTDAPWVESNPDDCVVCLDLRCSECGLRDGER